MSEQFFDSLSGLDKDQKVFELAALFMTVQDIAFFIGMDPEGLATLIKLHPENELSIAYNRGKQKTKIQLRYDIRRYAESGSPDAIKEMLMHLAEQNNSENA